MAPLDRQPRTWSNNPMNTKLAPFAHAHTMVNALMVCKDALHTSFQEWNGCAVQRVLDEIERGDVVHVFLADNKGTMVSMTTQEFRDATLDVVDSDAKCIERVLRGMLEQNGFVYTDADIQRMVAQVLEAAESNDANNYGDIYNALAEQWAPLFQDHAAMGDAICAVINEAI